MKLKICTLLMVCVAAAIAANPQSVEDFHAGKERALQFLVGQVMKETKGKANPGKVNDILRNQEIRASGQVDHFHRSDLAGEGTG